MLDRRAKSEVTVVFHPQEWVDSPGEVNHRDKKQLIPARERDSVAYTVPKADATDNARIVSADESYEANVLQTCSTAPAWVNYCDGPELIRTNDD